MKFTFIGVPGEQHESLSMFGATFPLGESVEIEGDRAIAKLKAHPHFEVAAPDSEEEHPEAAQDSATAPAEAPKRRGRPPKV